jgi:DUF971 family protein
MTPYPTKLSRLSDDRLRIEWSDGRASEYTVRQLRDACPCATCREKRSVPPAQPVSAGSGPQLLPILKPGEAAPLRITGMTPVGNYAYSIAFSDGHDTGIYSFERLRELGEPPG